MGPLSLDLLFTVYSRLVTTVEERKIYENPVPTVGSGIMHISRTFDLLFDGM